MDIPDIAQGYGAGQINYGDYTQEAVNGARRAHEASGDANGTQTQPEMSAAKQADMANEALKAAGLKTTEANIRLVLLLLENELPINKEALGALSRLVRFAGEESAEKAIFLMKNGIPQTLTALEALGRHTDGERLMSALETLAKNIMEMPDGQQKQRILAVLGENPSNAGAAQTPQVQNAAHEADTASTQSAGREANTTAQSAGQAPNAAQEVKQTHDIQRSSAQTVLPASSEETGAQATPPARLETGNSFFRETFLPQTAAEHLRANPISGEAERFIDSNLEELKNALTELSTKGEITKEGALNLIRSVAQGKLPVDAENEAEIKSFMLRLAEKSGLFGEIGDKAERLTRNVQSGVKRITAQFSVLADEKGGAEKIDKATENLREKLSLIARELGNDADSDKLRKSVEDVKETLKFLNNFKETTMQHIPLVLNGLQNRAELYVFSRKGGKNGESGSQSALLSLDLANLGHFETYIQKTGRSVMCQFRIDGEDTEVLVRENMKKLHSALKQKGYELDAVMFKKNGERFAVTDGEPDINEACADGSARAKNGMRTFDLRT